MKNISYMENQHIENNCGDCKYFEATCSVLLNKTAKDKNCNWEKSRFQPKEYDQSPADIEKELLELITKAGRRMYHDLCHVMNDVKEGSYSDKFMRERVEYWETIFYNGRDSKNYRARLHMRIMEIEHQFELAKEQLKKAGIEFDNGMPF